MSRRKQSNPKPLKRQSDGEDDDQGDDQTQGDIKTSEETPTKVVKEEATEDSVPSEEQSEEKCPTDANELQRGEEETEEMVTSVTVKTEPEINGTDSEMVCDVTSGVIPGSLIMPDDVLFLKKVDDDDVIASSRPYLVCNSVPLPKGSCFGPFHGELVSLSSIQQGDLVLQAQERDGETGFVRVLEETGAWLSLLRPPLTDAAINSTVFFEDGRIWCQIVTDLKAGSELLASFSINNETDLSKSDAVADDRIPAIMNASSRTKISHSESNEATKSASRESSPGKVLPTHAALLYGCPYCGVRFSSSRTLQGHLTFYCSKKPSPSPILSPKAEEARRALLMETERGLSAFLKRKQTPSPEREERDMNDASSDVSSKSSGPQSKFVKTGELYKCQLCSYSTDKQSSLNRHKRIHNRGDSSPEDGRNDTYCARCNIQFSSYSTYRCHRDVYCPMRSADRDGSSTSSLSPSIRSPDREDLGTLHAGLPTTIRDVVLKASSASASGQARVILAPPIVAPSVGSNGDVNFPAVIVQPVVASADTKIDKTRHSATSASEDQSSKLSEDQPLDLSTNKADPKKVLNGESTKQETKILQKVKDEPISPVTTPTKPQMSPNPVTPNSKLSPSPSHSSGRSSERPSVVPSPILTPALPPLLAVHQLPFLGNIGKPVPPVPHAVSKCIDCNIVFYKRENYLIHKKHYCSSRRNKSPESDDSNSQQPLSRSSSASFVMQASKSDHDSNSSDHDQPEKHSLKSESPRSPKIHKTEAESASASGLPSPRSGIPDEVMYRFYCIPCKIRFSSASTLKAHKEFYCPHGKESEHSIVVKKPHEEQSNTSQDSDDASVKCDRCDAVFASSRLLKHHFCSGMSTHMPLTRCMYCDFVTQTEMRLHEHMKAHMPNKAYRCTLCGYRGNTVRGMRMHGKSHLDNGEEFTDENMIEIEEPPLMPIKLHGNLTADAGPLDIEAELIRMKNEPYKRRRSRKSYEKAEYASSIPPTRTPVSASHFSNVCVFCGQVFTDISAFAMHLKIHEMMALQAASALENSTYKCQHCSHIADTMDNLFAHVCAKHPERIPRGLSASPKSQPSSPDSNSRCSSSTSRPDSSSKETKPETSDLSTQEVSETSVPGRNRIKSEPVDAAEANCSEEEVPSFQVRKHIKEELLSPRQDDDERDDAENIPQEKEVVSENETGKSRLFKQGGHPIKEEQDVRTEVVRSPLGSHTENKSTTSSPRSDKSPGSRGSTPKSKPEVHNGTDKKCPPLVIPRINHHILPYYNFMPDFSLMQSSLALTHGQTTPSIMAKGGKPTTKYCHHCDISFTYQATYLAHKKYYCSASMSDDTASSAKA